MSKMSEMKSLLVHAHALLVSAGLGVVASGCGLAASDPASASGMGVSVQALSDSADLTTCSKQLFKAFDETSDLSTSEFAWSVRAPAGADYEFTPAGSEFTFFARTAGEYHVDLTACNTKLTDGSNCVSLDYPIVVALGADANQNGIGDACETKLMDCTPNCEGRACGPDPACGTSCGSCGNGTACDLESGQCVAECVPNCGNRQCGVDPACGTSCGSCSADQVCNSEGQCEAPTVPSCQGRVCGKDPVDGTDCGSCDGGSTCTDEGQCVAKAGRVVTIVMSLTNHRLEYTDPFFRDRARLAEQSVEWASGLAKPKVLIVRDDACQGDAAREPAIIRTLLKWRRISADYIVEPQKGLVPEQLQGYDVVWFSNPEAPIDDEKSVETLKSFVQRGGGLVLQGQDITRKSSLESLTGLHNVSDGETYCGQSIAKNRLASYEVRIEREKHPLIAGLRGDIYYYGADIDSSNLIPNSGATVLAWAGLPKHGGRSHGSAKCMPQPVVVAHDMNP